MLSTTHHYFYVISKLRGKTIFDRKVSWYDGNIRLTHDNDNSIDVITLIDAMTLLVIFNG